MLKNKKIGQVSIFIIIGVILIMVSTFLIYNSGFEIFQTKESKLKNQVSDIVKDCVRDFTNKGLFQLGFQGGRIEIPKEILLNPKKYVNFGFKIPNWDSELGDIPTIQEMQTDLENYIQENSMSCINGDLEALSEFLNVEINDTIKINAKINEQNVIVESYLPIKVNEVNSPDSFTVEDYFVKVDSMRIGDLYNLATEIYNLEENNNFVEDLVLDQIYSSSDYSDPNSMPSEGLFFSCSERIWPIQKLKQNLANLNNNNFKYLYFEGTYPIDNVFDANLNKELKTYNLRAYFEKNYKFKLLKSKNSFKNYRVEIIMPSTEITGNSGILSKYPYRTFEVTPSSGGLVKSMDLKIDAGLKIPIPCIQLFHHLYTLDYDLIVKITDFNDDGNKFSFQFPLRVDIKSNNPKVKLSSPILNIEKTTATNENYCADNSKQFPLQIFAKDNKGNFLSDVNISYKCISLSCDLGKTKKPKFQGIERIYAQPYLETKFPYCIGGEVIAEKSGFHKGKIRIDTTKDLLKSERLQYKDVKLIPLKIFNIDYTSFLIIDKDTRQGKRVRTNEDGEILLSVENKGLDFESTVIWPNSGGGYYDKLKLLDDDGIVYNLSITYSGKDYGLRGYINLENWKPNINSGNSVEIVIPVQSNEIKEDEYLSFNEYTNFMMESGDYGIFFR